MLGPGDLHTKYIQCMAMEFLADNGPSFPDFTHFPRPKCPNVLGLDSP
jgi:hypothetical protein